MKKFWLLGAIMLCLGLSSCLKDDDEGGDGGLVGKWQLVSSTDTDSEPCDFEGWIEFKSDGTISTSDACENTTTNNEGTWKKDGNQLTLVAYEFPIPFALTIVSLTSAELVLNAMGDIETYKKL